MDITVKIISKLPPRNTKNVDTPVSLVVEFVLKNKKWYLDGMIPYKLLDRQVNIFKSVEEEIITIKFPFDMHIISDSPITRSLDFGRKLWTNLVKKYNFTETAKY